MRNKRVLPLFRETNVSQGGTLTFTNTSTLVSSGERQRTRLRRYNLEYCPNQRSARLCLLAGGVLFRVNLSDESRKSLFQVHGQCLTPSPPSPAKPSRFRLNKRQRKSC